MKKLLLLLITVLPQLLMAQARFITEGNIVYERKINLHRQLDEETKNSSFYEELIKRVPVFHQSSFSLQFTEKETIYQPAAEVETIEMSWLLGPAKDNIIYTKLAGGERNSLKAVFEKKFLVSDSAADFKWRIVDEKRTIAGLECRKAVTIICDSVYVVAFYAEEIPVSGGPESFGGLPGMILGLAIPRLHATWFATKVTLAAPPAAAFAMKGKGQRIERPKLISTVRSSMSDWGKYGEKNMWWILL